MPHAAPEGAGLANAQPAQQLAVLPARPKAEMALAEAREVSRAALDVDDGLGVARGEGGAAASIGKHADTARTCQMAAKPKHHILMHAQNLFISSLTNGAWAAVCERRAA